MKQVTEYLKTKGVWIDDNPSLVLSTGIISQLAEIGFDNVIIVGVGSKKNRIWFLPEIIKAKKECDVCGLKLGYSIWPQLDEVYHNILRKHLARVEPYVDFFEVDVEHQYKPHQVRSWEVIAKSIRMATNPKPLRLTTLAHMPKISSSNPWMQLCDQVNLQAYSVRKRGKLTIPRNSMYGPRILQARILDRARLNNINSVNIGLAAWSQSFEGITPEEAMDRAYQQCIDSDMVTGVTYWSSKWICGKRDNGYAKEWLRKTLRP